VRDLTARGITLIYVSHRLEELFALCDRITVLRDGRHVATESIRETNPKRVVQQMIGRELLVQTHAHLARAVGSERLRVENLSAGSRFKGINFAVSAGEVVGLAGLVGAGRSEVAQAILGLDVDVVGRMRVGGRDVRLGSIDASLRAGIGLVPEDRKRQGLVLTLKARENTSLAALPRLTRAGWIRRQAERDLARHYVERLQVRPPSVESPTASLSGGNQQKIALAKWLARECDVLMVDEPTRGIDVGAKAEIYALLDALACEGKALLVISSELPELIGLCRRILVMRQGRLVADLPRSEFSESRLMEAMAGIDTREAV
jgi:ABC-type sugar transport system ATPase subunit